MAEAFGEQLLNSLELPEEDAALTFRDLNFPPGVHPLEMGMTASLENLGNGVVHNRALHVPVQTAPVGPPNNMSVDIKLCDVELWDEFNEADTEMIITKSGRCLFPVLKIELTGLNPDDMYSIIVDFVPVSQHRWKFVGGKWSEVIKEEKDTSGEKAYVHPLSPCFGRDWMEKKIVFSKLKLTNKVNEEGHVILSSFMKYLPQFHVVKINRDPTPPSVVRTKFFPQTAFIAVTTYQNGKMKILKKKTNPFAKAFRAEAEEAEALGVEEDAAPPPHRTTSSAVPVRVGVGVAKVVTTGQAKFSKSPDLSLRASHSRNSSGMAEGSNEFLGPDIPDFSSLSDSSPASMLTPSAGLVKLEDISSELKRLSPQGALSPAIPASAASAAEGMKGRGGADAAAAAAELLPNPNGYGGAVEDPSYSAVASSGGQKKRKVSAMDTDAPRGVADDPVVPVSITPDMTYNPALIHVLVVDDDIVTLILIERFLKHYRFQVTLCENGEQALMLLRANNGEYDVVLCDCRMPLMDGFMLLDKVRRLFPAVPVIMMSGGGIDEADKSIALGGDDYLYKPMSRELLKRRIDACMESRWRRNKETKIVEALVRQSNEVAILKQDRDQLEGDRARQENRIADLERQLRALKQGD